MFTNLNMKKIVLWLFIAMVCAFAAAGAIQLTSGFEGTVFSGDGMVESDKTIPVDTSKSFSMDGIKNIYVSTVSEDVTVIPSDSQEIKVHLYGKWDDTMTLKTNQNGDNLELKVEHKPVIGIRLTGTRLKLDVYVPKAYAESLNINTVSAKLDIKDLNLKGFKSNSVSGGLEASGLNAANAEIHTTSGAANIEDFKGNLVFSSVSGDLDVSYAGYENDSIRINTTSGRSKIKLPDDAQFSVKFTTVSGKLDSSFPITTMGSARDKNVNGSVGAGGGSISVSSVSGDVNIYK